MNGNGPVDPMAGQRSDGDVGSILGTWMATVAPSRAPERLLEESFARTMTASQLRAYPWHTVPRVGRSGAAGTRRLGGLALAGIAVVLTIAVAASLVIRPSQSIGGPTPPPSPSSSPSASVSPSPNPLPSPVVVQPIAAIPARGAVTLATDGTSVWLFTTAGNLVRIDPSTNTVAASVTLTPATDFYQSLAGDRNGLWVTDWDASKALRFDPQTLKSTGSIDTVTQPKGVLITRAAVWIANTRGGSVQRIDPKANKVVATITVGPTGPSGPNWLAEGFGSIWVGVPNVGSVFRINEATNAIQANIPVPAPASPCGGMAAGTTAIWITSCDGSNFMTQIDPVTNKVVGTIDAGGHGYTFALIADRPWLSPENGQIVRLDPISHAVDRVVSPGPGFVGGGDVVVAAGSLWIIDYTANRVLRLPSAALGG
ncbi:MAG: virginiamycin lyase [Chloroflexota bacterium]|nr:virginiamycin lyase [Chloroflexota bacterium]